MNNQQEKELKNLYGNDYKEMNDIRCRIANNILSSGSSVCSLIDIIRNPIPIKEQELEKWIEQKNMLLDLLSKECDTIEKFVREYHLK